MDIQLSGYFDKNFGDDIMQLLVVRGLRKHHFFVNANQREMVAHLINEPNVSEGTTDEVLINVIGTGFMYNSKRSRIAKLIYHQRPKKYLKTAVVDCSIEPISGIGAKYFTKQDLNYYNYISCRDRFSYEFIKNNCKKSLVNFFPDIVFSFMRETDKLNKTSEFLGIAPIRRVYSETNYEYYKSLAAAADNYVENSNKNVRLFAFDNGIENDGSACGSVKLLMKNSDRAEIIIYNSDPIGFIKEIAKCEKIISSRFHGCIIAIMLGIPTYAVYDNLKIESLCKTFDINGCRRSELAEQLLSFVESEQDIWKIKTMVASEAEKHIIELRKWIEK